MKLSGETVDFQRPLFGVDAYVAGTSIHSLLSDLWHSKFNPPTYFTIRDLHLTIKKVEIMARKRSPGTVTSAAPAQFRFINVQIEETAYEDVMEFASEGESLLEAFVLLLETGYKFSFSLNAQNDMFVCAMTDRRDGSATENACLTGAADNWYDALRVVLYKHTVILKQNWNDPTLLASAKRRIM